MGLQAVQALLIAEFVYRVDWVEERMGDEGSPLQIPKHVSKVKLPHHLTSHTRVTLRQSTCATHTCQHTPPTPQLVTHAVGRSQACTASLLSNPPFVPSISTNSPPPPVFVHSISTNYPPPRH